MQIKNLLLVGKNIITATALISMLFQSALPFTYALPAYAQEVTPTDTPAPVDNSITPTSTPTDTVAPTDTPTQAPTDTVTPTPDQSTVTPTPTDSGSPTITPTDVPTVVPTDTATDTPTPDIQNPTTPPSSANTNSQGPPSNNNNSNVTPTPQPPTPTVTPAPTTDDNGVVSSTIVKNVSAPSLDLGAPTSNSSASITTNKADYSPTDTAVISGSGFLPNKAYTLEITSSDAPAVDFTTVIQMNDQGAFVYAYQLDGNYRPNYAVYVKDGSNTVATTTFTDSSVAVTVNGSPSVTVAPNASITAAVTTTLTGNDNWKGTEWLLSTTPPGTTNCVNTSDYTSAGTYTESFTITAPPTPGTYNLYISVDGKNGCGTSVSQTTLANAVVVSATVTPTPPASFGPTSLQNTFCMADQPKAPQNLTCTANDIQIASVDNINIVASGPDAQHLTPTSNHTSCDYPGEFIQFTASWHVQSTATTRYNVGLWFANNGQTSALHGTCSATTLPSAPSPFFEATNDTCGDINSGSIGTVSPAITVVAQCNAAGTTSNLALPYCTSWNQNEAAGNACSDPTGTVPGAPSKCSCNDGFSVPITVPPVVEVLKTLNPSNDPGKFNLLINGTPKATNVGNGGDTGNVVVVTGSVTFGESAGTNTSLSNYSSTASCVLKGTTTTVPITGSGPTWTITNVANAQDIVCTITNNRNNGTIELKKTWVGIAGQTTLNIGTAAGASDVATQLTGAAGAAPQTTGAKTVNTGTYYVSEIGGLTNYTSGLACTDNGNAVTPGTNNSVSVTAGHTVVCTFTNTLQQAYLTLVKTVTNDNGGTASASAWTLSATGNTNISGSTGSGSVTNAGVLPGTYTLSESGGPNGYANGTYSCVKNSGNPVVSNSITLANGDSATCTVNNNDNVPSLTLVKQVVGGSDAATAWTLTATGASQSPSNLSGTTPVVSGSNFKADTYMLAESNGPTGYTASTWSCTNGITVTNSQITLGLGQSTTCTITNTRDQGTIVLNKVWSGTPGQTTLNIGTTPGGSQSASQLTGANGTAPLTTGVKTVNTGTYYVSETGGLSNYTPGLVCTDNGTPVTPGANNSVAVNKGDAVVCTFTNTRQTGTITVKKTVVSALPDSGTFNLQVDGTTKATGGDRTTTGQVTVDTGTHAVAETSANGTDMTNYTSTYACTDNNTPTVSGNGTSIASVTVNANDNVVCTFTNTRNTVDLKVQKVVNDGSPLSDWGFSLNGGNAIKADATTGIVDFGQVNTNTNYTITEGGANQGEYTLASVTGTNCTANTDNSGNIISGTANIPNGASGVTCVFTNDRQTGTIQVKKVVVPSDAGATSWDFAITGQGPINTTDNTVTGLHDGQSSQAYTSYTGNYTVTESGTNLSNYTTTSSCTDGTNTETNTGSTSALFTLMTGKNYVCTFTNTIKPGTIQVYKYNDLNANGVQDQGEPVLGGWTINVSSNGAQLTDSNGLATFSNVLPGTYTLSETLQNGWFQSNISCGQEIGTDNDNSHPVTVTPGATTTCYIGNYQDATIHVTKVITDPAGHVATGDATVFAYSVGGSSDNVSLGNGNSHNYVVAPGLHTVTETLNQNYDFKGCDTGVTSSNGTAVTVTSGQTLNVTCTNQQKKATINVNKQVVLSDGKTPVTDDHSFTAQLNGANGQSFSESTPTSYSVNPGGPYTVGEAADANYTGLGCKLDTGAAATSMTLASNQTVTVTCTNEQNPGTISGHKYDANGLTPISGWVMQLISCSTGFTNCQDVLGVTATTDNSGYYQFANLVTGFYQVREILKAGWTNITNLVSGNITINPGTVSTNNDFVNFKNMNITVCKKQDLDGNKNTTNDQLSVSNWTVQLTTDANTQNASTSSQTTGDNGCTKFTNLGPNHTYTVSEVMKDGWQAVDGTATSYPVTVQSGDDQTFTFYNFHKVSISGSKFNDVNGNGNWDQGEPGLGKWTIDLYKWDGSTFNFVTSTVTATDGSYSFPDLGPGTYRVREEGQTGWVQITKNPDDQTVSSGSNVTGINFGNQAQGTVVVTKYLDDNANGTMDASESGLPGWDMTLDSTTKTTAGVNGTTTFTEVPVGSHTLGETQQQGWTLSNIYCSNDPSALQTGAIVDTTNSHDVSVDSAGQTVYCYVGNYQNANITVTKVLLDANGNPVQNDNTLFGFSVTPSVSSFFQLANLGSTSFSVKPGSYDVSEFSPEPNYSFVSCHADYGNNSVGSPIIGGENVTLGSSDSVIVTCTNKQNPGKVIVTKYNDDNQDGVQDNGEQTLSGWTINLADNGSLVTDQNGQVTFNDVNPGTHNLSENIQSGWIQTNIVCSSEPINPIPTPTPTQAPITFNLVGQAQAAQSLNNSNNLPVSVAPNQTVYCTIGNKNVIPVLSIAKTNNTGGNNKGPGDLVLYTITVTATQSAADNVTVTDLLPQGFVYQGGSWTANSDVRGDLKALGITTEPTYHSPGTWQLGNMSENETVTLTLLAAVTNVEPGDYKDVTWAQGQSTGGVNVLALAQPTGFVDTNFVGTDVNVVNSQPITSYNATQSLIQSVLGAELPGTGANVLWIDLAVSLLLLGFSSVMIGKLVRRKYHA